MLSVICLVLLAILLPGSARATAVTRCDAAAARAARETGVPLSVLLALTRTETGRSDGGRLTPWPWTVNIDGAGHWFDTREDARAFVTRNLRRGVQSFDVGCFQINYKWHGAAFDSVDQMFEPLANARYAAGFLARLFDEFGDWSKAAGAYHSRTEAHARRYRARFDRIVATVPDGLPAETVASATDTPFASTAGRPPMPLLAGSRGRGRNGSLVPPAGAGRAFIALASRF